MTRLKFVLFFICAVVTALTWAQENSSSPVEEEAKLSQLLEAGARLAANRKFTEAIEIFDKVAFSYESKYKDDKSKMLAARWQVESLMYLLDAAKEKKEAKVVSVNWAYAYYLKAFALLELGRIPEAKALLEKAIALSPRNSQFLSEIGNVYQREKNWNAALQTFQQAEAAASEFSPPNAKNSELTRAWRGMGYVFVELGQLDEAENMYRKCIDLNKNDTRALNELRFIERLKAKQGGT